MNAAVTPLAVVLAVGVVVLINAAFPLGSARSAVTPMRWGRWQPVLLEAPPGDALVSR